MGLTVLMEKILQECRILAQVSLAMQSARQNVLLIAAEGSEEMPGDWRESNRSGNLPHRFEREEMADNLASSSLESFLSSPVSFFKVESIWRQISYTDTMRNLEEIRQATVDLNLIIKQTMWNWFGGLKSSIQELGVQAEKQERRGNQCELEWRLIK